MTERHEIPKRGRNEMVNADPAHAPGKQHIERGEALAPTEKDPRQYERNVHAGELVGRKPRLRRGR